MTNSFSPAPAEVAYTFMTDLRAPSAGQRAELRRRGVPASAIDHDPDREGGPIRIARVVFEQGFFNFASEDGTEATLAYVSVARDWRGYASDIVAFDLAGRVIADGSGERRCSARIMYSRRGSTIRCGFSIVRSHGCVANATAS